MARIVIVDDSQPMLTSLRMAFTAEGYAVDTFHDPIIALPKVIFEPPNLLILNGQMPGMHGIEFFQAFRRYSRAKVVILSASAEEIEAQLTTLGLPADAYFNKPVTLRNLVQACTRLLQTP